MLSWALAAALAAAAPTLDAASQGRPPLARDPVPAVDAVPAFGGGELVAIGRDRLDRLTVPVSVDQTGPYRFFVDTGSERTILSRRVAERLGLQPSGRVVLLGIAGPVTVDTVSVEQVTLGRRSYYGLTAPLLDHADLAADGIVGLDGLQNQRVVLDFENGVMAVDDARELGGDKGYEIVVRARPRSGRLVMTNALVDGVRAAVVIDTGTQGAIANRALQRKLLRRNHGRTELISVTGQSVLADLLMLRSLKIGAVKIANVSVAVVDAPPFAALGLDRKPALFLGMSELRAFKRVAIDFKNRKVLLDLPAGSRAIAE